MKTKPTRIFTFDTGLVTYPITNLTPEDQTRLLNLTPEPRRNDARYSTLAPQSRRHINVINERGKYQRGGGESW